MNYTLIIPIYNEVATLYQLIKILDLLPDNIEIIIVNDGSDDGTDELLNDISTLIIIKNDKNRGKGYSIRKGLEYASSENIILADGDLEIDIAQIPHILKNYETLEKSVLVGTRWSDIKLKDLTTLNDFGNYILNQIFNIIYRTDFNDILCCLKIMSINTIKGLNLTKNDFSIESELMAKLALKKIPTREVIVDYKRRSIKQGKKLKMINGWDILLTIIETKLFFKG